LLASVVAAVALRAIRSLNPTRERVVKYGRKEIVAMYIDRRNWLRSDSKERDRVWSGIGIIRSVNQLNPM
jgi:hypothetical protein